MEREASNPHASGIDHLLFVVHDLDQSAPQSSHMVRGMTPPVFAGSQMPRPSRRNDSSEPTFLRRRCIERTGVRAGNDGFAFAPELENSRVHPVRFSPLGQAQDPS